MGITGSKSLKLDTLGADSENLAAGERHEGACQIEPAAGPILY